MVKWVAFIFRSLDLFVKNFACNNKILHTCMDHVCGVFPPPQLNALPCTLYVAF